MEAKTEKRQHRVSLEKGAERATRWIGSTQSLITHSVIFVVSFMLPVLGITTVDKMLLVLTTLASLEAIYLSIFIQMSVNKNSADIEDIQEDVEEIQENVEEIQENVEGIQEDVEEIHENVEGIQEDVEEIHENVEEIHENVEEIHENVEDIQEEISEDEETLPPPADKQTDVFASIQQTLAQLQKDINELKRKQAG